MELKCQCMDKVTRDKLMEFLEKEKQEKQQRGEKIDEVTELMDLIIESLPECNMNV